MGGSSLDDLREMPIAVRRTFGTALGIAQIGGKAIHAKPLKGFGGAGVLEVIENFDKDTYRAVYTVKFEEAIYVLHCFKKQSKSGNSTPAEDFDLIKQRYKKAEAEHKKWKETRKKK